MNKRTSWTPWFGWMIRVVYRKLWDSFISHWSDHRAILVRVHQYEERLDTYLRRYWRQTSRGDIRLAIRNGSVNVNFRRSDSAYRVRKGDFITIRPSVFPELFLAPIVASPSPSILYEDRWLLIINKPPGLIVHQNFQLDQSSVISDLFARHNLFLPPYIDVQSNVIHRLDRPVSGVLMVARSYQDAETFREIFKKREIYKEYRVIATGRVTPENGTFDAPIRKDERTYPSRMIVDHSYHRSALTEYTVIRTSGILSECRVILHTGRTHQIRVHFEHAGFPIFGDRKYSGDFRQYYWQKEGAKLPDRLLLHAHSLNFRHPFTGRVVSATAPVPEDFSRWFETFRGFPHNEEEE